MRHPKTPISSGFWDIFKKGLLRTPAAHPRNRHSRPRLGHCRKHSYRFPRGRIDARPRSADATELSHQTGHCHAALHEMVRPSSSCREGRRAGEPVALAHTPLGATKRAVGLLVLLLVISGIWPLPLINVLPAVTTALLAIALLGKTGSSSPSRSSSVSCRCLSLATWSGSRPAHSEASWAARCIFRSGSLEDFLRQAPATETSPARFGTHMPQSGCIMTAA